jgi:hypothetical protein
MLQEIEKKPENEIQDVAGPIKLENFFNWIGSEIVRIRLAKAEQIAAEKGEKNEKVNF